MKRVTLDLKIEKGIPIPEPRRAARALKYPWDKMLINDSVFIPCKDKTEKESARSAAISYGKKRNMVYVSRAVEGGVRVWRTK